MTERIENTNTGSTGGLGYSLRSYDRAYCNYPGVIHDADTVRRLFRIGQNIITRSRHNVTRGVLRAMVPSSVLEQLADNPETAGCIEAVVPTRYATRANGRSSEPLWMMLAAINNRSRTPLFPVDDMVRIVDSERKSPSVHPVERITHLRAEGYRFITDIPEERIGEVETLWGNSFEWKRSGIVELRNKLHAGLGLPKRSRTVWFSGLVEPEHNTLAAIATAERLDIPIAEGVSVPIVESTEWRRADHITRHGLATAVVSHLHANVVEDLSNLAPTIIAETNYRSGAHRVGFASGMDVPARSVFGADIPQMLIQNVRVGDGLSPDGERDFTLLHIPEESLQTYYHDASREVMLKGDI